MKFLEVPYDEVNAGPLLAGMRREYTRRYGSTEFLNSNPSEFQPPQGLFLVVEDGSALIACGGFCWFAAAVCEIKRVWTDEARRREGLALAVVDALEKRAAAVGYERIVLETGPGQLEALALYRSLGYERIPSYGPFEDAVAFQKCLRHDEEASRQQPAV